MSRRSILLLVALAGLSLAVICAVLLLPRLELGGFAARRLEAQLGRAVAIGSLRIAAGRSIRIAVRNARIANIEGGTAPAMATLAQASAEIEILPLLRGSVVVRRLDVDGFSLLLERAADRKRNWRFGDRDGDARDARPEDAAARSRSVPTILALTVIDSALTFRTSSGAMLRTTIATARATTAAASAPVTLRADGSYNAVPLTMHMALGSFDSLRDAHAPYPVLLAAASRDTTLVFRGTSTMPLDADGLEGALTLTAPTVATVLALGGAAEAPPVGLMLSGQATRQGDRWGLADISGELDGAAFSGESLVLTEGAAGEPDAIAATLAFTRLDADRLLAVPGQEDGTGPDMPLRVALTPDPLVQANLAAASFTYGRLQARDVRLRGEIAPARITLEELSLFGFGAHLSGRVDVAPAGDGARLAATGELRDSELDALRRSIGLGPLPVAGQLHGRASFVAEGTTLNDALRGADGTLVLAMSHGSIAREVIELASTDIRALFRTAEGETAVTCMIAVVTLRDGAGTIAPLHLRAGTGAISGIATFDLNRQSLDMVIGSRRESTHTLALDIPVRISGPFRDLSFAPADAGPEERARTLGARNVAALPEALREEAMRSACYRSAMRGR